MEKKTPFMDFDEEDYDDEEEEYDPEELMELLKEKKKGNIH